MKFSLENEIFLELVNHQICLDIPLGKSQEFTMFGDLDPIVELNIELITVNFSLTCNILGKLMALQTCIDLYIIVIGLMHAWFLLTLIVFSKIYKVLYTGYPSKL